jgi:hypothetical protein
MHSPVDVDWVLTLKWFAVANDTIGGWSVMIDERPPSMGGLELGCFISEDIACHLVDLHNESLR